MPPCLDVYVLSRRRDPETINRFIETWLDRANSEERGDEELMLLPLGAAACPNELDGWEWEPADTLTQVVERGLDRPSRAFTVYLQPRDPFVYSVCLTFTADDQVLFGVSLDDEGATKDALALARRILDMLALDCDAQLGCVAVEEPPTLFASQFPIRMNGRILLTWSREAT